MLIRFQMLLYVFICFHTLYMLFTCFKSKCVTTTTTTRWPRVTRLPALPAEAGKKNLCIYYHLVLHTVHQVSDNLQAVLKHYYDGKAWRRMLLTPDFFCWPTTSTLSVNYLNPRGISLKFLAYHACVSHRKTYCSASFPNKSLLK